MQKIGIITGLAFEAKTIVRAARYAGVADRVLCATGLGRDAARAAAERLIADGAGALLSFGIAAGLDPNAPCGTAVIATTIKTSDGIGVPCTKDWGLRLEDALSGKPGVLRAPLADAALILTSAEDKAAAFAATGAAAADMESYGVGEAATDAGLPFAAVRVIADTARDDLPSIAAQAMADDGTLKLGETLGRVARDPAQIPGLIGLGLATARATRRLEDLALLGAGKLFYAEGAGSPATAK